MLFVRKASVLIALLLCASACVGCGIFRSTAVPVIDLGSENVYTEQELDIGEGKYSISAVLSSGCNESVFCREEYNVMYQNVIGHISEPFLLDGEIEEDSTLTIYYDEESLSDIGERNLCVLYISNDEQNMFFPLESAEYDFEKNCISISSPAAGSYLVVDSYVWLAAWGADLSDYEFAHDSVYTDQEYGFSLTVPKEIGYTNCSDYLHTMADGSSERQLLYTYENKDGFSLEVKYVEFLEPWIQVHDKFFTQLEQEDDEYIAVAERSVMSNKLGQKADYILIGTDQGDGSTNYSYTGYFSIPENDDFSCIMIRYCYTDADKYQEIADRSLHSVTFGAY